MLNTISMANMRPQNLSVAGKNQVGFAGLWGKTESSDDTDDNIRVN